MGDPFDHRYSPAHLHSASKAARYHSKISTMCIALLVFAACAVRISFASQEIRCGDYRLVVEEAFYAQCGTITVEPGGGRFEDRADATWVIRHYQIYRRYDGGVGQEIRDFKLEISATQTSTVDETRSAGGKLDLKPVGIGVEINASIDRKFGITQSAGEKVTLTMNCEGKVPGMIHFVAVYYSVFEIIGAWSPALSLGQWVGSLVGISRSSTPFYRRVTTFLTALCDDDSYTPDRPGLRISVNGKALPPDGIPRSSKP